MKPGGFFLFIIIVLLFAINISCDPPGGSFDTAYSFRGTIIDAESGLPVEGAWIVFDLTDGYDSSGMRSDSSGFYDFIFFYGAGKKDTTLYFGKEGYETHDTVVRILFSRPVCGYDRCGACPYRLY